MGRARELSAQEGVQVDLVQGDIERLAMFRDGRFDIIITCFGMEFLPDPGACLRECFRVLRGGGMLVMGTVHPLTAFEWDADDEMLRVTDYFNPPVEVWEEPTQDETQKGLTFFRSFQEMFGMLVEAGFQVEQVIEPAPYGADDPRARTSSLRRRVLGEPARAVEQDSVRHRVQGAKAYFNLAAGTLAEGSLTAADRAHNLDFVTFGERDIIELFAADYHAVMGDGDEANVHFKRVQVVNERRGRFQCAFLAVYG